MLRRRLLSESLPSPHASRCSLRNPQRPSNAHRWVCRDAKLNWSSEDETGTTVLHSSGCQSAEISYKVPNSSNKALGQGCTFRLSCKELFLLILAEAMCVKQ